MEKTNVNNELSPQQELDISNLINDIYSAASKLYLSNFRDFALECIQKYISFQGAIWFNRREAEATFLQDDIFSFHLPENFMENYNTAVSSSKFVEDPFAEYGVINPNVTFTIPDVFPNEVLFKKSHLYQKHCKYFNLSDVMSNLFITGSEKKQHIISLYKFDGSLFTAQDKTIFSILTPHLNEAMVINLIFTLQKKNSYNGLTYKAIGDRFGNLLEAEAEFNRLLREYNSGIIPPIKLDRKIKQQKLNLLNGTEMIVTELESFLLFEIEVISSLFTLLSPQQKIVAKNLLMAKSDKEIAKTMGLSAATISNHLKIIFKKLGVSNRTEAIVLLNNV